MGIDRRGKLEKEAGVQSLTETMAKFTAYIGKHLPTDVEKKLAELRAKETKPLAKAILEGRFAAKETIHVTCVGGVMRFGKA